MQDLKPSPSIGSDARPSQEHDYALHRMLHYASIVILSCAIECRLIDRFTE
jgi:hypothetical protein